MNQKHVKIDVENNLSENKPFSGLALHTSSNKKNDRNLRQDSNQNDSQEKPF